MTGDEKAWLIYEHVQAGGAVEFDDFKTNIEDGSVNFTVRLVPKIEIKIRRSMDYYRALIAKTEKFLDALKSSGNATGNAESAQTLMG